MLLKPPRFATHARRLQARSTGSFGAKLERLGQLHRTLDQFASADQDKMSGLPRDVQAFLAAYPGQGDDGKRDNALFYTNRLRCRPDSLLIDELHARWFGDYSKLERKHGFIQWLFPIREHGMNYESQPLQPGEINQMQGDASVKPRLVQSYRLMLDFYGMQLKDEGTGELARSDAYKPQFRNLSTSSHNYLRISRILKCFGELGLENYPAAFILFILNQQSQHGELDGSTLKRSLSGFWVHCNRRDDERQALVDFVQEIYAGNRVLSDDDYSRILRVRQEGKGTDAWFS